MVKVHLLVGPVGAGKSTLAAELARQHQAVRLILDEWMTQLFRPDRPDEGVVPWYIERAERCIAQIWRVAQAILAAGRDVVLEIGLLQRSAREDFYARIDAHGVPLVVHVVDAPREVRRERVLRRNVERGETFAVEVPPAFFEFASDRWEPVAEREAEGRDVRFVWTG